MSLTFPVYMGDVGLITFADCGGVAAGQTHKMASKGMDAAEIGG